MSSKKNLSLKVDLSIENIEALISLGNNDLKRQLARYNNSVKTVDAAFEHIFVNLYFFEQYLQDESNKIKFTRKCQLTISSINKMLTDETIEFIWTKMHEKYCTDMKIVLSIIKHLMSGSFKESEYENFILTAKTKIISSFNMYSKVHNH